MGILDSNKVNNTPEPSTSIVISNEDDSSVGDYTKDSKNASIEELEERPTANWIRRQLQHFAQARREVRLSFVFIYLIFLSQEN